MINQRLSLVLALIGCFTGAASLTWQIYGKYAIPHEIIEVGRVARAYEMVRPDKTTKYAWRFIVPVANVGTGDVYVSAWIQGVGESGKIQTIYPIRSQKDDKEPLRPGEVRVFELGEFSDEELLELGKSLNKSLSAWVATSRGKVSPILNFTNLFIEAQSISKKKIANKN